MKRKSDCGKKFDKAWKNNNWTTRPTKAEARYWYLQGWKAFQSIQDAKLNKALLGSPTETSKETKK